MVHGRLISNSFGAVASLLHANGFFPTRGWCFHELPLNWHGRKTKFANCLMSSLRGNFRKWWSERPKPIARVSCFESKYQTIWTKTQDHIWSFQRYITCNVTLRVFALICQLTGCLLPSMFFSLIFLSRKLLMSSTGTIVCWTFAHEQKVLLLSNLRCRCALSPLVHVVYSHVEAHMETLIAGHGQQQGHADLFQTCR